MSPFQIQKAFFKASIFQSLKDANRVVELALQGSDFKITFKTDWIAWSDLAVVTFSDTSFANEAEFKSQKGRIHYITSLNDVKSGEHKFHLVGFGSSTLKRVTT